MAHRIAEQPNPSAIWTEQYTPEVLRSIGSQVEALLSQHNSLEMYKRSIERQLVLMAVHLCVEDVQLLPRSMFLLVELRGSGGCHAPLDQIARILGEVGYWKPPMPVQNYRGPEVYHLGQSTQKLFDDYAALDRRVQHLHAQLGCLREQQHMQPETTSQEIFTGLATSVDTAKVQAGVDTIVRLLEQPKRSGWFRRLFVHLSRRKRQARNFFLVI